MSSKKFVCEINQTSVRAYRIPLIHPLARYRTLRICEPPPRILQDPPMSVPFCPRFANPHISLSLHPLCMYPTSSQIISCMMQLKFSTPSHHLVLPRGNRDSAHHNTTAAGLSPVSLPSLSPQMPSSPDLGCASPSCASGLIATTCARSIRLRVTPPPPLCGRGSKACARLRRDCGAVARRRCDNVEDMVREGLFF